MIHCSGKRVNLQPQRRATDADTDADVENAEQNHRNDEEDEGGEFHQRPMLGSVDIEQCAKCRFQNGLTDEPLARTELTRST